MTKRHSDQDNIATTSAKTTVVAAHVHVYAASAVTPAKPITFSNFVSRKRPAAALDIVTTLTNLKATSVDPERFFRLAE